MTPLVVCSSSLAVVVAYVVGVHFVLTALPRHLLPIQLPLWIGVAMRAARVGPLSSR